MSGTKSVKQRAIALVGEVDQRELAVRLIEAHAGIRRPPGKSATELLLDMPAEASGPALAQAHAALTYISECIAKGGASAMTPSIHSDPLMARAHNRGVRHRSCPILSGPEHYALPNPMEFDARVPFRQSVAWQWIKAAVILGLGIVALIWGVRL